MRFSEVFNIKVTGREDWFDPILSLDTRLFVDPFLLFDHEKGPFKGSHQEIIGFFDAAFQMIAECGGDPSSRKYQSAVSLLRFPEVAELCLGYTVRGTRGAGSGTAAAVAIADALSSAIRAGLERITHFEEVGIFQEGIGADRISDATAGIIRHRLAAYTAAVCKRYKLAVSSSRYYRGMFDAQRRRWKVLNASLPINPYTRRPVLLVPQAYLRELPTINPEDFWNYCLVNENELIRNELSAELMAHVRKADVVRVARRNVALVKRYLDSAEKRAGISYDFGKDRKGLIDWYNRTKHYVDKHPLNLRVGEKAKFKQAVSRMVDEFRHFVEENNGWRLLWNDNSTRRDESAAQNLFLGIVKHYCRANDIDVSPETDIVRGPVDFKASKGYRLRALIEIKLARNSRFWNGLNKQLPTYLKAERCDIGYFVVVCFDERDLNRVKEIQRAVRTLNSSSKLGISVVLVDASRDKPSASKL